MTAMWQGREVVVCVGTGGVGKTTVSAAIGLAAARAGRKTLVMTIDPARRLANALGLEDFGNVEHEVTAEQVAPYGIPLKAPLWVMMPDVKRTFDELIFRTAPSREQRERILENRFYQSFSSRLAGSLEYASVEKLYEVHRSGRYDLIVLDTPPSQNASNFLDAPGRIINFLDNEVVRWLSRPFGGAGRLSLRLFDVGSSFFMRTLGRLTGGETLRELSQFLTAFSGMYEGFRERSIGVRTLLESEQVAFSLVTGTSQAQLLGALRFAENLDEQNLPVRQVVINRVRDLFPPPDLDTPEGQRLDALLRENLEPSARRQVLQTLEEEHRLAQADAQAVQELASLMQQVPVSALPEQPLDVHDLHSLAQLHHHFLDERLKNHDNSAS